MIHPFIALPMDSLRSPWFDKTRMAGGVERVIETRKNQQTNKLTA